MNLDRHGRNDVINYVIENDTSKLEASAFSHDEINHRDMNGWTALHFAAQAQNADIAGMLLNMGGEVDVEDEHGNTPLFKAVFNYRNSGNIIELLLKAGADPDNNNRYGVSPRKLAFTIANYDARRFF